MRLNSIRVCQSSIAPPNESEIVASIVLVIYALLISLVVILPVFQSETPKQREAFLFNRSKSAEFPVSELQSLEACERSNFGVGNCIESESFLRLRGENAWRDANLSVRYGCLKKDNGKLEPAAMLYACLVRGER